MNNIAKQLLSKGYNVIPISKALKSPIVPYKDYIQEHARSLLKMNMFENNDIVIALNRNICCIDIDNDGLISSKIIFDRLCGKFPAIKDMPIEKTKNGYHIYFSCDDEKLKRNLHFLNSNFLDIKFDKNKYDTLTDEQKKKVVYFNDKYLLPVDFLIGFHNGTPGVVRTAPSTNIETVNELPYLAELSRLPDEIYNELELVGDKVLKYYKDNKEYVKPVYTPQQIEKVKRYIQYLNPERFNNMKDFAQVTMSLSCVSDTLIDEWLDLCRTSKLWNEQTSLKWCTNFYKTVNYKHHTINSFVYLLKEDNNAKFEEFRREKEIIDTKDITSSLQHVDLDNHHDERGYLKYLPYDKPFIAVQSPLGSGKTYQIKKLIEKCGNNKTILLVVGRCSLGMEFTYKVFKDLGFEYYKDVEDIKNCQRLVIQVDSIFKMYDKSSPALNIFDWIIVDEAELIADRLCEVDDKNRQDIFYYFNWCIKNCKKVILSDGQLSQNVIDIFSEVRNEKPFVLKNSFNRNKNVKHRIYHEFRTNKRQLQKFNFIREQLINDVKNGKTYMWSAMKQITH